MKILMASNETKPVTKRYQCPVCKKMHEVSFPANFAENRAKYPFTFVYMHKYINAPNVDDTDKDILTTLYLDAHLNIRGVEALLAEDDTNIVSKEISREMVAKLTKVILEMQKEMDVLQKECCEFKEKYEKSQQ
ncbi:MAG: hypothetical protein ACTSVZ_05435 [Promethearchaeota archaeon]